MSWGEFFKDWGSLLLSILCIIGGVYLFFRYDRKTKKQEIKKYQQEEDLKRQANINCNPIVVDGGHRKIRFFNSGQADALNVRIDIINKNSLKGIHFIQDWGPYDLISPKIGYREEDLFLCEGCTEELKLCMKWDDDFGNNRSNQQTIQL